MDAQVKRETRFLPALAEAISEWFPELGGRSLAVSDATITKENIPTLPLVMVAFVRSAASPPRRSSHETFEVIDTIIVEFWLAPERYKRANGSETPFWSYYDYEAIRDKLLSYMVRWETPSGERISYIGLQIQADALSVTLTFTFEVMFRWCPSIPPDQGVPFTIKTMLCAPEGCCPDIICVDPNPCDPCK